MQRAEGTAHVFGAWLAMCLGGLPGCYSGLSASADGSPDGAGTEGSGGSGEDSNQAGTAGDDSDTDGDDDPSAGACDSTIPPSAAPMRRLSKRQYENALLDLTGSFLGQADATAVLDELSLRLSVVPDDVSADFRRLDQTLSQGHIDGYYHVGRGIGVALTESSARLEALAGTCATDGDADNDFDCVRDFVQRFGRRAFRRPMSDEELDFYARDATGNTQDIAPESFAERVSVMLMVPDFVYIIEDDNEETGNGLFELSPHEVASRLSFHFWQSIPDEELLTAAEDGTLEDTDGYETQVRRMFEDPRTRRTLDQFTTEWLRLEEVPALDILAGTPAFDAFAGDDSPSPELRDAMVAEVQDLVRYFVYDQEGSLDDVLTSNIAITKDPELAELYRVPTWEEGTEPGLFPEGERGGLITRAAFVVSGSPVTHPVIKGLRIRTRLLCDTLPPPPADIPPPPQLDPVSTIREQLELLTEREGTACLGCHVMINPLGYATENYDGLGRSRTHEQIYDLSSGELLGQLPVDTVATPHVVGNDDRAAQSAAELSQFIADSGRADACLSRHYFRFAYGRVEDPIADACAIESLEAALDTSGSLREMLLDVAFQPEFSLRYRSEEK